VEPVVVVGGARFELATNGLKDWTGESGDHLINYLQCLPTR